MLLLLITIESHDDLDLVNQLFSEHQRELYNIAMSILHDRDSAEEAVQETFVKIIDNLQKIKRIPCPDRVKFCVVITKHASIDIIRKQQRVFYLEDVNYLPDDVQSNPEEHLAEKEERRMVAEKVLLLSDMEQQLIQMKCGNGMTYKQIGAILGISEGLANKRTQRAIAKLKHLVNY